MTDWTIPRVRILGAAAAVAALGVVFAFIPWRISDGPLRQEAERRIRTALAAPNASIGEMSFVLMPTPTLHVRSVAFTTPGSVLTGSAPMAQIGLKIAPLVKGVAKPTSITLRRPELVLNLPERNDPWLKQANHGAAALADAIVQADGLNGLLEFSVRDGRLKVQREGSPVETVEALSLSASLSSPTRPLKLQATGRVAGGEVRLSFAGAAPRSLITGTSEPVSFKAGLPGLSFEFLGNGTLRREIALKGTMTGTTSAQGSAQLPAVFTMLGLTPLPASSFRATLETRSDGATFSDLTLTSGRQRFDGVGSLRHDGQRWQINATMATASVDLTPLLPGKGIFRREDGGWSSRRLDLDGLFDVNVDFRLSADKAIIGPQTMTRAAFALMTRQNRIEATLGDSVFAGGRARSRIAATRSNDGIDVRTTASLEAVNLGEILVAQGFPKRATGSMSLTLALDSSGTSAAQFAANADGRISASIRGGDVSGIDLDRLATRRTGRPELALAEALGGRTAFESATLNARITRGLIGPVDGQMQAGRLVGSLGGGIDLPGGEYALGGSVTQLPTEPGQVEPLPVLDFSISGPLTEPRISPNVSTLLKRS